MSVKILVVLAVLKLALSDVDVKVNVAVNAHDDFSESSLQNLLNGAGCDCCYRPGGCVLCNELPPANSACYCYYVGGFTCQGHIAKCKDGNSQFCKTPDWSKATCLQGEGDCDGY